MSDVALDEPTRFSILTVCTGNICRSPLAQRLLSLGLQGIGEVDVSSAGTDALVGHGMTDQTATIAHRHGVLAPEQHVARLLSVEQLQESSVAIALTRAHRREIVALLPRGSRRTFTLRELARLLDAVQPSDLTDVAALPPSDKVGRFAALIEVAATLRGYVAPPENELDDDVIDPYRRSDEVYALMESQLVPAVDLIVKRFEQAATITPDRV